MPVSRSKRKRLKSQKEFLHTLLFFGIITMSISGLLFYLWVYTEIDETLLAIEIQNSTANELKNVNNELQSEIESLSRPDVIARKARQELNMVYTQPETLRITLDHSMPGTL